jgi:ATP-binding cassette subfamily F protein 3
VAPFDGDLDDYRQALERGGVTAPGAGAAPASEAAVPTVADAKLRRREEADARRRESARRRPLEQRLAVIERALGVAQSRRAALESRLAAPDIYSDARKAELVALLAERGGLDQEVGRLESEWLEVTEAIDTVGAAA